MNEYQEEQEGKCESCGGTGNVNGTTCVDCDGSGKDEKYWNDVDKLYSIAWGKPVKVARW